MELIPRLFGVACFEYLVMLARIERQAYREKREAKLPTDEQIIERLNITRPTLKSIQKRIEEYRLVDDRDGRFRIGIEPMRELAKLTPRCRKSEGSGRFERDEFGKCRERTKPQPVMVRVPGSLQEIPIDQACSDHGGKGHTCECPLHRVFEKPSVDSKPTYENSCKVDFPEHSPDLRPEPPHPKPESANLPAESGRPEPSVPQLTVLPEAEFQIDELSLRLNQKLRRKIGSNVPDSSLLEIYRMVHTNLAWEMLSTAVDNVWEKCRRWRFVELLAADAGDAAREEQVAPSKPVRGETTLERFKRLVAEDQKRKKNGTGV